MARILQSADLYHLMDAAPDKGGLDANEMHWCYNALDSAVTLRVWEKLKPLVDTTPHAALTYQFERAMQGPALDMMRRGVAIQAKVRQDESERYLQLRTKAQDLLDTLADAVWGPETYTEVERTKELHTPRGKRGQPLSPRYRTVKIERTCTRPRGLSANSSKQVLAFFNIALKFPVEWEVRKTPQGIIRTPTANDKALKKWATARTKGPGVDVRDRSVHPVRLAAPFVSLILTIRDADKMLSVLRTPLDSDGRMRCSYNVAATENWRWCVTGDHEVLTPTGWERLDTWSGGPIAQWDVDNSLKFQDAVAQSFPNTEPLIGIKTRRASLVATPEHVQPYYPAYSSIQTATIGQRKMLHGVPVGGYLEGVDFLPAAQTKASVMMQADGCNVHDNLVRFHFSKERKIIRCVSILSDLNIPFKLTVAQDGTTYIYIYNPPRWLQDAKFFGPWVLKHDPSVFCDELKFWDGTWTGTATEYGSTTKENAEWVKTMGHLNGRFTSVFTRKKKNKNWADAHVATITVNTTTRFTDYYDMPAEDTVYCPQTSTGFFLVRHVGQIIVTGNSSSKNVLGRGTNLQNIQPSMRRMFCADDGYRVVSTDLEQAESYVVAGEVWRVTGDRTYLNAILSGDLHTQVCVMAWPELGWTEDAKERRALANAPYPGLKYSYRDVAKRIGHGSNYKGSAYGIALAVGIPVHIVEDFQRRYFKAFPGIPKWQTWVEHQISEHQFLDTPLGQRRWFFGRPNEASTFREAIACVPQGTVGSLLNLILWRCWRRTKLPPSHPLHLPIEILLQNHDAFLFQHKLTHSLPTIINAVNSEFLNAPITFRRGAEVEVITIPGEFVTGYNWAYEDKDPDPGKWTFKDSNPDGLRKWSGTDTRIRKQTAAASSADWLGRPLPRVY